MAKQSVGLLLYRRQASGVQVLIVHPGGPFFARKDNGVWSIPKGELEEGEDKLAAAKREFQEELGVPAPEGKLLDLGSIKQKNGKTVYAWAIEADLDCSVIKSNNFTIEWPPKSGQRQEFPEIDQAEWVDLPTAIYKLTPGQAGLLTVLATHLGVEPVTANQQTQLF